MVLLTLLAALLGSQALTATASAAPAHGASTATAARTGLFQWWSASRQDNDLSGTFGRRLRSQTAGYGFVRTEGYGLSTPQPGTVPLYLFYSAERGDNLTTATAAGIESAYAAGYVYGRVEAYIYPTQVAGTVPLYQFYSAARGDSFATATRVGIDSAYAAGYGRVRVEGYVYPGGLTHPAGWRHTRLHVERKPRNRLCKAAPRPRSL